MAVANHFPSISRIDEVMAPCISQSLLRWPRFICFVDECWVCRVVELCLIKVNVVKKYWFNYTFLFMKYCSGKQLSFQVKMVVLFLKPAALRTWSRLLHLMNYGSGYLICCLAEAFELGRWWWSTVNMDLNWYLFVGVFPELLKLSEIVVYEKGSTYYIHNHRPILSGVYQVIYLSVGNNLFQTIELLYSVDLNVNKLSWK